MEKTEQQKSKFSNLLKITEAIAVVGVIISIVSLTIQIRQNTRAVQAASYQNVATAMSDFHVTLAQDRELAEIYLAGSQEADQLSPLDQYRFEMLLGSLFAKGEIAVDLYNRKMVDDKMMLPYANYFSSIMQSPGVASWWKNSRTFFSKEMQLFIKERMEK